MFEELADHHRQIARCCLEEPRWRQSVQWVASQSMNRSDSCSLPNHCGSRSYVHPDARDITEAQASLAQHQSCSRCVARSVLVVHPDINTTESCGTVADGSLAQSPSTSSSASCVMSPLPSVTRRTTHDQGMAKAHGGPFEVCLGPNSPPYAAPPGMHGFGHRCACTKVPL